MVDARRDTAAARAALARRRQRSPATTAPAATSNSSREAQEQPIVSRLPPSASRSTIPVTAVHEVENVRPVAAVSKPTPSASRPRETTARATPSRHLAHESAGHTEEGSIQKTETNSLRHPKPASSSRPPTSTSAVTPNRGVLTSSVARGSTVAATTPLHKQHKLQYATPTAVAPHLEAVKRTRVEAASKPLVGRGHEAPESPLQSLQDLMTSLPALPSSAALDDFNEGEFNTNSSDAAPGVGKIQEKDTEKISDSPSDDGEDLVDPWQEEDVEEDEPSVVGEVLDATCLSCATVVMIRAHSSTTPSSIVASVNNSRASVMSTPYIATADGAGLGMEPELFCVVKASHASSGGAHDVGLTKDASSDEMLRYGDNVALRSTFAQNHALGVRRLSTDDPAETRYELGFFRTMLGQAEKWTILRGRADKTVSVGTLALGRILANRKRSGPTAAVRSGDPILLRNHLTGGLLSLQPSAISTGLELSIVTHSYDSDKRRNGSTQHASLLGRVQHHDRIKPTPREIFHLVHASVPPGPRWSTAGSSDGRWFLDGSYLLHPQRNDWNHLNKGTDLLERVKSPTFDLALHSQPIGSQPVNLQERLLLDDVIGSMMGLEGRYIKAEFREGSTTEMGKVKFRLCTIDGEPADMSLRNLVERILPLSTAYVHVQSYIASQRPRYEYGTVMQAFCEAIDTLVQQYLSFVAQMEQLYRHSSRNEKSSAFTMNKLYVQVKPSLETMSILQHVMTATRECKGGALLNILRNLSTKQYAGDEKAQRILHFLLDKASVPYMEMLAEWLEAGVLRDPYGEFMIHCREGSTPDLEKSSMLSIGFDRDDWKELHQVRQEHVLEGVLSAPLTKQKILTTGKYWKSVRYCRSTQKSCTEEDDALVLETLTPLSGNDQKVVSPLQRDLVSISLHIDHMHRNASSALLQVILRDFRLMETLRTMKRYFLLDQGDFFVHFLDSAEEELLQELADVSRGRIQNWLSMCVQLTERPGDELSGKSGTQVDSSSLPGCPLSAHSLRCTFAVESLVDHLDALHGGIAAHEPKTPSRHAYGIVNKGLTGIEAFMLDFPSVPFPTSLVISQRSLASYQLLFRHLFFAKHVERRLVGVWLDHQMMKELQSLRKVLGQTYVLRQRMLHFVQNLIYYMMFEVIEPNWLEMEAAVYNEKKSEVNAGQPHRHQTVDDILEVHDEFLRRTLEECLLTNRDLIRTLTKLMQTCLLFSDQMKRFMEATRIGEDSNKIAREKRQAQQRNLNDPNHPKTSHNKKRLRNQMASAREERRSRLQKQTARVERELLSNESYKRMISRFDEVFNANLGEFMFQLKSDPDGRNHSHRANLCVRLDYNGYVTRSMGIN